MNSNARRVLIALVVLGVIGAVWYGISTRSTQAQTTPVVRQVTDVPYDTAVAMTRTFLCVDNGEVKRDWNFVDRWTKPQLTQDTYVVDGRTYTALQIVTNDRSLPPSRVRFHKMRTNVGSGPVLEGHSYLRTLVDGNPVVIEREVLLVQFNGKLEHQRRPLSACGTPRQ